MNIPVTFIGGPLHGRATVVDAAAEELAHQPGANAARSHYAKRVWRIELPGFGNYLDQVFFVLTTLEETEAASLVSQSSKSNAVPVMA